MRILFSVVLKNDKQLEKLDRMIDEETKTKCMFRLWSNDIKPTIKLLSKVDKSASDYECK